MTMFKQSLLAAALVCVSTQANASIVSFNFGPVVAGSHLEKFEGLTLGSGNGTYSLPSIWSSMTITNGHVVQGSAPTYAAPYQDTTKYVSLNTSGSADFSLSIKAHYFGLQWGSVDTYNKLVFFQGNTVLDTIMGASIIAAANLQAGNQGAFGTVYANFTSPQWFNRVMAYSSGIAFEFDNVRVSQQPLPAALPMFLSAIMGIFGIGRRRHKALAAA